MKPKMRKLLSLLLAVVFLGSIAMMLRQHFSDREAESSYDTAQALVQKTPAEPAGTEPQETEPAPTQEPQILWVPAEITDEDPYLEEMAQLDLAALREVNPDVVGWIRIPGTVVNYPFLQGEDNEYYLENTWDGRPLSAGSIFLECRNSRDMTDFNTILYGHNMQSGSMFASIRQYAYQGYFDAHPYIYILTDQGVWRYEVFSSYQAPVDGFTYGLSFNQVETRETFLDSALESSVIETDIRPAVTDRVLTLSTCSGYGYSDRWVVHGRLIMVEAE